MAWVLNVTRCWWSMLDDNSLPVKCQVDLENQWHMTTGCFGLCSAFLPCCGDIFPALCFRCALYVFCHVISVQQSHTDMHIMFSAMWYQCSILTQICTLCSLPCDISAAVSHKYAHYVLCHVNIMTWRVIINIQVITSHATRTLTNILGHKSHYMYG